MLAASLFLVALALALAWPVPVVLSRAAWPARAPGTALLLWQAIALSGGLSMIGSLLAFGLIPFGENILDSSTAFFASVTGDPGITGVGLIYVIALCAGVLLGGHLVLNLVFTVTVSRRQRKRHGQLVRLLSSPIPDQPNTRLLDYAVPLAYCLPGTQHSITVFSAGLVQLLTAEELNAVIEHEKAHLVQRHYIVLMAFSAWRSALPWFPIATRAQREVGTLVEMLADDHARRSSDPRTLATAIALVALGGPGAAPHPTPLELDATGSGNDQLRARVNRLVEVMPPLSPSVRVTVIMGAVALLAAPTLLLLIPAIV